MLTRISGGTVYDPINHVNGETRDIFIEQDRIVAPPAADAKIDHSIDAKGLILMPGGIDIHSHIGGGKGNIARMMMTEDCDSHQICGTSLLRSGSGHAAPSTFVTGYEYAKLGYTMCFEPAVAPSNARHAHLEMSDTPLLDTGGYLILGNDEYFLQLLASKSDPQLIRDYVGWIVNATQCIGVKIVNPGGISAFKFNQRQLDIDEPHKHYQITPRLIVSSMAAALKDVNLSHPIHVHASNLGVPGNFRSTLDTINATDGLPLHLAHVQFHSYGAEGKRGFSSAALEIAEKVNENSHVTVDVGHVMFGQTVTISADTMQQFANRHHGHPRKSTFMDIECEAGCGVVPFKYRAKQFVNALQWAIGLELFLTIKNPWQVFLTTDHPNGASFTTYPHLIRLLMDKSYRDDKLLSINRFARQASNVEHISREYSLYEIAIITRAGPALSLGLKDRGHLGPGAVADVVLYRPNKNWEFVFRHPARVIKDGQSVVNEGNIVKIIPGKSHSADLQFDHGIEKHLASYFESSRTVSMSNFKISDDEMSNSIGSSLVRH